MTLEITSQFVSSLFAVVAAMASFARMSESVRAECYALRTATKEQNAKPLPYWKIAELVTKKDHQPPSEEAVRQAVLSYGQDTTLLQKLTLKFSAPCTAVPYTLHARAHRN